MIVLPKKDKEGRYFVSYSQIDLFTCKKGFDTGKPGKEEYIRKYFLNEKFPDDKGYAQFGRECEDYICNRAYASAFSEEEKKVLKKIKPLGVFQYEFKLEFDNFYLLGYIDDMKEDGSIIRDYKTASENSKKKYYQDNYYQLDIYALAIEQNFGKLPDEIEIVAIERHGNGFKGGREVMTVGENIWTIKRETNRERLNSIKSHIISTVNEISDYYKIFCKLNR